MEVKDIRIAYFIDRIIAGGTELQLVEQINRLEAIGMITFLLVAIQRYWISDL
jgi:hypothetical protein